MKKALLLTLALFALLITGACSSDEDGGTEVFHCSYEQRNTSCSSSKFGPWTAGCATVDFELREGLTAESFCSQAYPASDIECGGGCCISFQFRNVVSSGGPCP